jgi:hypothetical protein
MLICRNSTKKGNHEKIAVKYCLGNCGVVCLGTDHAAATYEDARCTATAADRYHNNDHDRRQRDDHRVQSRQHDRA